MAPVLLKKVDFLDYPMDFNLKVNKKRLFGDHKTWRGLFFGVLAGILITFLQVLLLRFDFFQQITLLNLSFSNFYIFGFLMGFGAIFGDAVESTLKRQINYKEGKSLIVFDQLDFVVGALIFLSFFYLPSLYILLVILLITPFLHLLVNVLAYLLKLKDVWW